MFNLKDWLSISNMNVTILQGEYIAPEMIENVYKTSQFVCQCFVDGDCFKVLYSDS